MGAISDHWVIAARVSIVHQCFDGADMLNDEERARALRFINRKDTERYLAAHLLKRRLLADATGQPPQLLQFGRHAGGKPYLVGDEAPDFSISHGGNWVTAGLSWTGCIGVDVEADRLTNFWDEIASFFLTPAELVNMEGQEFLKLWTAKEAALKAHGAGLAILPNAITVTDNRAGFALQIDKMNANGQWRRLDEMHMLAVATSGQPPQVAICHSADDLLITLENVKLPFVETD